MDREIEGKPTAQYLWEDKQVVPFLKTDKGLADEKDGVQLMKPFPELDALLDRGVEKGIFGTKMRSVVKLANEAGIKAIVDQQFEIGKRDPGQGPGADPRARGRHQQPGEGPGRGDLLKANLLAGLNALSARTRR